MRLLIPATISMFILIPGVFAQESNFPSPSSSTPLYTPASSAPAPSNVTLQDTEQQHPEWFRETGTYRPCPWNMCPAPR
jgi:hypothetical protein